MERQPLLSSLVKRRCTNVHLEGATERLVPPGVGVRVRKREDGNDALPLLFFSTFTKHARTLPSALADGPLPLCLQLCTIGDSPRRTQRQGVEAGEWRDRGRGGSRGGGGGCL